MGVLEFISSVGGNVDRIMVEYLSKGTHPEFLPVLRHQVMAGGKRIRPAVTCLSCQAVGGELEEALRPAAVIELIHNYSLIMDDLIDRGDVRRGKPTVRSKFGEATALLAGMFYREVLDELVRDCHNSASMRELFVRTIKETIEGERLDMLMEQAGRADDYLIKHRLTEPKLELYSSLIEKKTATLFRAASEAGGIAADCSHALMNCLTDYGWKIGLAFQVMDDYLDIFGERTGKQKCKDIFEHKLGNAAIILALQEMNGAKSRKLLGILRRRSLDRAAVKRAFAMIEETSSRSKTREWALKLIEESKNAIGPLPETEAKDHLLGLADFVVERLY